MSNQLLLILFLIVFIFLRIKQKQRVKMMVEGGGKRKKSSIDESILLYVRMQNISKILSEEQMNQTHSTWGESFFYGYVNTLFIHGYTNTDKDFPLIPNYKLIYKTLKDITYWSKYGDEQIPAEMIEKEMTRIKTVDKELKNKILSLIYEEDVEVLKERYPKVTRDDIISLLIRHASPETNINYTLPIRMASSSLSLPPPLYKYYEKRFGKCVECFAGPINHTLDTFCAVFKEDKIFGAIGPFSAEVVNKYKKEYTFIANPPYDRISLHLAGELGTKYYKARFAFLFPSKDGKLFHTHGRRQLSKRKGSHYVHSRIDPEDKNEEMNEAIYTILTSDQFSGFILIPRELMRYYDYGKRETKSITYDTIIMFSFRGRTDDSVYDLLSVFYWKILKFGYDFLKENWFPYHGFPNRIVDFSTVEEEIREKFKDKPKSIDRIIKSMELSYNIVEEFKELIDNGKIDEKLKEY